MSEKKYTLAEARPRIEQFLNRVFPLAGFKLDYTVTEGEGITGALCGGKPCAVPETAQAKPATGSKP